MVKLFSEPATLLRTETDSGTATFVRKVTQISAVSRRIAKEVRIVKYVSDYAVCPPRLFLDLAELAEDNGRLRRYWIAKYIRVTEVLR